MSAMPVICITVAYALPERAWVGTLTLAAGSTALQAINQSGVQAAFPELTLAACRVGIFSKVLDDPAAYVLADGDRVEVYRPLLLDPKEARRQRAQTSRRRV